MKDGLKIFGAALVVLGFAIWVAHFAPCSWYGGTKVQDVPLRCLDVVRR